MNLEEYSQYRETLLHEQPGFAYNTYICTGTTRWRSSMSKKGAAQ